MRALSLKSLFAAAMVAGVATAAQGAERVDCISKNGVKGHYLQKEDYGAALQLMLPRHPYNSMVPSIDDGADPTTQNMTALLAADEAAPVVEQGFLVSLNPGTERIYVDVMGPVRDRIYCKVPDGWAPKP